MVDIQIKWQPVAIKHLIAHYQFLFEKNERAAVVLYNLLRTAPDILRTSPYVGQIEPLLSDLSDSYRYLLVQKKYKIIYAVKDSIIEIHAVWDCRQHEVILRKAIK